MKTKNFALGCLLLLASIPSFAQIPGLQKGSFLVGGTMDLSFVNYKNEATFGSFDYSNKGSGTSITFSPQVGYFVAEGLTLGGLINLTNSTTSDEDEDGKYTVSNFSVGPFFRYYTKSKIFFHGEYTFGSEKTKVTGQYEDGKQRLSGWKLGTGYAAFLNDHIALEPHVMYTSNTTKETDDQYTSKVVFGRITVGLAFTLFLSRE